MGHKIKTEIHNTMVREAVYPPSDHNFNNSVSEKDTFNLFNAVNRYYNLYEACINNIEELNSCFAVKLSNHILDRLKSREVNLTRDKRLPQSFYDSSVDSFLEICENSDKHDSELLEIYMKQCVLMLKQAGLLCVSGAKARITKRNDSVPVFLEIFDAFWNKNEWGNLFPSDEKSACKLKNNRQSFRKILLKIKSSSKVETLANNFFAATGFAEKNNLFMISFIDFYLLTWLTHFGIVEYDTQKSDKSVYIQLTETGRALLSILTEE